MNKPLIIILAIIIILILLPKPYDTVGGITGEPVGPWKCLGFNFNPINDTYPDAQNTLFCIGIPYK